MASITGVVATMDVRHAQPQDKFKQLCGSLVFGDGASTYPTGGIPITLAQLGFRNTLRALNIIDMNSGDGYIYKFNLSTMKIRIYTGGASTSVPLVEVSTAFVPVAGVALQVEAEGY